jgi:hypothetical protein
MFLCPSTDREVVELRGLVLTDAHLADEYW